MRLTMLEWLWPWVFVAAPLPLIVHRWSRGESLQPSALRAPFASRWRGLSGSGRSVRSGRGYWWLLWLTWMMLVVATARPARYEVIPAATSKALTCCAQAAIPYRASSAKK